MPTPIDTWLMERLEAAHGAALQESVTIATDLAEDPADPDGGEAAALARYTAQARALEKVMAAGTVEALHCYPEAVEAMRESLAEVEETAHHWLWSVRYAREGLRL